MAINSASLLGRRDVFFIDASLPDLFTLTSALSADAEIHFIDATQDGLEQIALELRGLQGESGIDAIHIFSHSSAGELLLGSTTLSSYNINSYAATLSQIGSALSPAGDILLYGCNVAAGDEGRAFVESFARLTQADVAASDDVTGSAALDGDWMLEVKSGVVEAVVPMTGDDLQQYTQTLGSVDDYILAKMSLVAYYDDPAHPKEKEPAKQLAVNAWEELKAAGWQVIQDNWELSKGHSHYKNTVLGLMLISHQRRLGERISLFSRFFFSLPQSLIPFWYTVSTSIALAAIPRQANLLERFMTVATLSSR